MALVKQGPVFSLNEVDIKKPTDAAGAWTRIPGINSAAYKGSVSTVDVLGDNQLLGVLRHTAKGVITVKAEYVAMGVLEKVSGNVGTSAGSVETLAFGTLSELGPPAIAVRAFMPVSRFDGSTGTVVVYWYQTQVDTAFESFPSGEYGKLDEVTITFNCYRSVNDENNAVLTGDSRGPATGAFGRVEFQSAS